MESVYTEKLVAIGRIMKARGLEGEFKVKPLTDFIQPFGKLRFVKGELPGGEIKSFEVEKVSLKDNAVLLKLKGIVNRAAADALRGLYLQVTRNELFPFMNDEPDYNVLVIIGGFQSGSYSKTLMEIDAVDISIYPEGLETNTVLNHIIISFENILGI